MSHELTALSRRALIGSGLAMAGAAAVASIPHRHNRHKSVAPHRHGPSAHGRTAAVAAPLLSSSVVRPALLQRALAALDRHDDRIRHRDRIGIVDFAAASASPRFHLIDISGGTSKTLLVAHGSGSDPDHTGWLKRFSNVPDSNASCDGAFRTGDYYMGKHGRSQRLFGLDSSNDNALERAIVIHGAWYANDDMVPAHGMLGRSQGCFAVGEANLSQVFAHLGEDRLLFAAKM